ncbi:MAG: immunoglobulin-like domain-containing protein, partial [Poseidonibacter sp.]|uniref:immunoglobulin-like domain-containing protein n=1 Tax=Poseidonibacter sp. TaxID=2321188 RepID=UPI00359EB0AA
MATIAGSIKSLSNGIFSAKDENGNIRILKVGDVIYENDTVFGSSSNSSSSQIEIELSGNDVIVLSEGQKQLIDSSLIETAFGTEELFFTMDGADVKVDETDTDTATGTNGDVTEEETAAGEEIAEDGTDFSSAFQDRDGNATNIVSDLRQAQFGDEVERTIPDGENLITADLSVNDISAYEDDGFLIFTVSLDRALSGDVTFDYSTSPITATENGTDYTDVSGTITIPAGSTSVTIRVPITDDYISDNGETININISNVDGNANIVKPDGVGTILDEIISTDTTTVTLTASPITEDSDTIIYTATVDNAVTETPLVVTLDDGTEITIPVGATTADSDPVTLPENSDVYNDEGTIDNAIAETTGGNFEDLDTSSTVSTPVEDTINETVLTLEDVTVDEGGTATIGLSLDQDTKVDLVVTLDAKDVNGDNIVVTIPAGTTAGTVITSPAFEINNGEDVYNDNSSFEVSVVSTDNDTTEDDNFELLTTTDTATVTVEDTINETVLTLEDVTVDEGGTATIG